MRRGKKLLNIVKELDDAGRYYDQTVYTASLVVVMGLATGKKSLWIFTAVEAKSEVRDKAVEICRQLQNNEQEEKKKPLKLKITCVIWWVGGSSSKMTDRKVINESLIILYQCFYF